MHFLVGPSVPMSLFDELKAMADEGSPPAIPPVEDTSVEALWARARKLRDSRGCSPRTARKRENASSPTRFFLGGQPFCPYKTWGGMADVFVSLDGVLLFRGPGSPEKMDIITVDTLHISCASDQYKSGKKYVGLILYGYEGKLDDGYWYMGGKKCRPGYVVLVDSSMLKIQAGDVGVVHGAAFRSVFGSSVPKQLIGEGFSVQNGNLVGNSYSFNTGSDWHDSKKAMNPITFSILWKVVEEWKKGNGKQNYPVRDFLRWESPWVCCCGSHPDGHYFFDP